MNELEMLFEAQSEEERLEDFIETIVLSVQIALQKSMHQNCVSQKELASRMGVSPARVSQILCGDQANLTLKTVGKIAHALGEDFELVSKGDAKRVAEYKAIQKLTQASNSVRASRHNRWEDKTANLNRYPFAVAA